MDGQMSEDIRIGILVRTRLQQLAREAMASGRDGSWRRKAGDGSWAMTFGSSLLEDAGGIDRLFAEWEMV